MNDVVAKKYLGQHWLNDDSILESICDDAQVKKDDSILEIGPGKGSLTEKLLNRGAQVFAVEFDSQAVNYLKEKFNDQLNVSLHLEQDDIRKLDLRRLNPEYKLVANIPYYLTSHLIYLTH